MYTNIHDLRSAMAQISTRIGQEASHISVPDEGKPSMNKMMMLDAEFREKQNQLQTLIEQRKAKYVFVVCLDVSVGKLFNCNSSCNNNNHENSNINENNNNSNENSNNNKNNNNDKNNNDNSNENSSSCSNDLDRGRGRQRRRENGVLCPCVDMYRLF